MVVAANGIPGLWLIVATLVGGTLAAGGANAFNMVIDRDIDAIMERTKRRPLVTGVMSPRAADHLRGRRSRSSRSPCWRSGSTNSRRGSRIVGDRLLRRHLHAVAEASQQAEHRHRRRRGRGARADRLVGGHQLAHAGPRCCLFLVIFIWTPPHFWALAVRYRDDYEAANVPMMPVVASLRRTTLEILVYSVLMWALTMLIGPAAHLGWVYAVSATVLGGLFTFYAFRLYRHAREDKADVGEAMRLFHFSITYLTALFVLMAVDVLVRNH